MPLEAMEKNAYGLTANVYGTKRRIFRIKAKSCVCMLIG